MSKNKENLCDKFAEFYDFIEPINNDEMQKKYWNRVLNDYNETIRNIIDNHERYDVNAKYAIAYNDYIYINIKSLINGNDDHFLTKINNAKNNFPCEINNLICDSLDILINENYELNDTDDPQLLFFRFIKLFIPKYIIWDEAWKNQSNVHLNNELHIESSRFNKILAHYNIHFDKGDTFPSIYNKIRHFDGGKNKRIILDLINFYYTFEINYRENNISFYYRSFDANIILTAAAHIKVCETYIKLHDIEVKNIGDRGKGHGSKLLKFIIDYVNEYHKKDIKGYIKTIDDYERLKKWYTKFGFDVNGYNDEGYTMYQIIKIYNPVNNYQAK